MIWPFIGAAAAGGTALACGLGIPISGGKIGSAEWRVRWACWRWKAEVRLAADPYAKPTKWEIAGYGGGWGSAGKEAATEIAMSRAATISGLAAAVGSMPPQPATASQRMILIGKKVG